MPMPNPNGPQKKSILILNPSIKKQASLIGTSLLHTYLLVIGTKNIQEDRPLCL